MDIYEQNSELFGSLMAAIRSSGAVYSQDVGFVRSLNKSLASSSEKQSQRLLNLINRLNQSSTGDSSQKFENVDDLIKNWNVLEHTFDTLIDKLDSGLNTIVKPTHESEASSSTAKNKTIFYDKTIPKPQEKFDTPIDNQEGPFRPLLTQKPHALVPLRDLLKIRQPDESHADQWYEQPYKDEIAKAQMPPAFFDIPTVLDEPRPLSESQCTWIDTPDKLSKVLTKLCKAKEIAVDLEHHDYRSYLGLVCLMQISTRDEDWLIDTLALRTELQGLNEVFCDPSIVKVFHGATADIIWLQRDLGLYVVNLFDTYHASHALELPRHSLAYLLEKYANFIPDKQYQLADWRIRPLGPELTDYARGDTHFLLYVYDRLRQDLSQRELLQVVIDESKITASQRYEKPGYNLDQPAWLPVALKHHIRSISERNVLERLWRWRDLEARKYDESPRFIMPNHILANLSIIQPESAAGVLGIAQHVTHAIREAVQTIVELILEGKKDTEDPYKGFNNYVQEAEQRKLRRQEANQITNSADAETSGAVSSETVKSEKAPNNSKGDQTKKRSNGKKAQNAASENIDIFSPEHIAAVARKLRLDLSQIYGEDAPVQNQRHKIDTGVIAATEIKKLELGETKIAGSPSSPSPATELTPSPTPVQKESTPTQESSHPSNSKHNPKSKKLNIVENMDAASSDGSIRPLSKRQKVVEDQPAFDFAGASPIFSSSKPDDANKTYKQFKGKGRNGKGKADYSNDDGPRPAHGPRKSKAKTFRS